MNNTRISLSLSDYIILVVIAAILYGIHNDTRSIKSSLEIIASPPTEVRKISAEKD